MLKNHIKIAWRNLKRNPLFSTINILGLSTGLASAFLIYFWVADELGVDRFHENADRLYQVMESSTENGQVIIHDGTQGPLAQAMEKDLPEVEQGIMVMDLGKVGMPLTFANGENTFRTTGLFASPNFFEAFSYPMILGSKEGTLADKNNIAISKTFAEKIFGSPQLAMGKAVDFNVFGHEQTLTVSGVYSDPPQNSTMQFDYVATQQKLLEDIWTNGQQWYNTGPATYLLLTPGVDATAFNQKIVRFIDNYDSNNHYSLFVRAYADAYLKGNYEDGVQTGGRITYVRLFSLVALLVLVIACINFMNLSTARVSRRFKEIGIKKTVGGTKGSLIGQFLVESMFITLFSLVIALALMWALLPLFNFVTGKELGGHFTWTNLGVMIGVALLTGLLAGSYPAFYLSGFSPLATLKGKFSKKGGELFARKGLVVFQFTASLIMIISVLVIGQQLHFALTSPMGYAKENLIHINLEGKAFDSPQPLLAEWDQLEGVQSTGLLQESLVSEEGGSSTYGISWPGKTEDQRIDFVLRDVDEDLIPTMGISMVAGQAFSKDLGDPASYLIFNEEAIRLMGIQDPVGKKVVLWGAEKTILGVMKDFHTASVMQKIGPVAFSYGTKNLGLAMVKLQAGKEAKALAGIQQIYQRYNPGYNLDYGFQDQTLENQYLSEQQVLQLSRYFAYLAIFISCLGLFGLAAFNTELRKKEIGIRKVLGSSSTQVLGLLASDFIKLVLLAIVLAVPVAWYAMDRWLLHFAYRISLGWWVFAAAGLLTIGIALATIWFQSFRAIRANPSQSLRTE